MFGFGSTKLVNDAIKNLTEIDIKRLTFIQNHMDIVVPWLIEKVTIYAVYHCDDCTDIERLTETLDYLQLLED